MLEITDTQTIIPNHKCIFPNQLNPSKPTIIIIVRQSVKLTKRYNNCKIFKIITFNLTLMYLINRI